MREALGLTLAQVGESMHLTRQRIHAFEHAEARDRITLASLQRVAEAMGCELVYRIVPKSGSVIGFSETRAEKLAKLEATKRVLAVEHTMALEDQAAGDLERTIDDETKRILRRSKSGAR